MSQTPVQRYGATSCLGASHQHLAEYITFGATDDGPYVLHSDFAALAAQLDGIKAQRNRAIELATDRQKCLEQARGDRAEAQDLYRAENAKNNLLRGALDAVCAERDALARFKVFVHSRLDQAGIPSDPPGKHRDEGCRVGQRLEYLQAQRDALLEALKECLDAMDGTSFVGMRQPEIDQFTKAMDRAQAAIARATTDTTEKA